VLDSTGFFQPFFAVAERGTDTEFEFDFFDDSPTTETARTEAAPPPLRRRRLPTRPPTGGTPLLRLAGLILGIVVLVAFLVVWLRSCQEGRRAEAYRTYMENVGEISAESETVGRDLNQLLFSPGVQLEDLQAQLNGLRDRQSQTVQQAESLDVPGPLREQHERLTDALELRVSGLNGLAVAFSQVSGLPEDTQDPATDDAAAQDGDGTDATTDDTAAPTGGATEVGTALAEQANRLIASDVVYDDFFRDPAKTVMDDRGVVDVAVPNSNFVTTAEFASAASWQLIVERLTLPPGTGGGGLHGNRIATVRALPAGEELSTDEENTVKVSERLAFEVSVENSGDNQETQVKVTLTIQQSPEPIRKEATIDAINPGDIKTVTFGDLGTVAFGPQVVVRVNVEPVAGETNTNNNTAEYPMIFTL
jgi:CARDB